MSEPESSPTDGAENPPPAPPAKVAFAVAVPAVETPAAAAPVAAVPQAKGMFARLERMARRWLGPKPIRHKLTSITMLACTAALVLSGVIFFTFDIISQFFASRTALQSLSRVVADNSRDSLERGSSQTVLPTLNALMDYPHVTGAILYRADGRPFARPAKHGKAVLPGIMENDAPMGTHLGFTSLTHYEPVMHGSQKVGTLAIEIGLGELWERLRLYAVMTLIVFVLATAVARLLLGRLQGMISEPVVALAQVADTVAKENNYSLRAEKRSEDEVGQRFGKRLASVARAIAADVVSGQT